MSWAKVNAVSALAETPCVHFWTNGNILSCRLNIDCPSASSKLESAPDEQIEQTANRNLNDIASCRKTTDPLAARLLAEIVYEMGAAASPATMMAKIHSSPSLLVVAGR